MKVNYEVSYSDAHTSFICIVYYNLGRPPFGIQILKEKAFNTEEEANGWAINFIKTLKF